MADSFPDALMVPTSFKEPGRRMSDRAHAFIAKMEPILGVDRDKGERAWVRLQVDGDIYITKSIHDTLLFAKDHELAGQSRYRWTTQPDGMQFGYLVEDAKD